MPEQQIENVSPKQASPSGDYVNIAEQGLLQTMVQQFTLSTNNTGTIGRGQEALAGALAAQAVENITRVPNTVPEVTSEARGGQPPIMPPTNAEILARLAEMAK